VSKPQISNPKQIWAHRTSIKGTQLFFIIIKAIIIITNVLPRSLCSWSHTSLRLLQEGHNHPIVRFSYLCHMIGKEIVFFSRAFLYIKLFELGVEVAFNHRSAVTHHKVNLFKFPLRSRRFERTNDAFVLLICFCIFHLWEPLVPICRPLEFKIWLIFRASLIATPSGHLFQKRFTKPLKDPGSRLYRTSWLFLTSILTSISCAFSVRSSLLQILRNSSRRHCVFILPSLSSLTNLSLLFGFCTACMLSYRCLQMEWWAAVTVVAIPSQPALLMWPCVSSARLSVLSPRACHAIQHSRQSADCILPILVRKTGYWCISCRRHPNCLLRCHGIVFVTQILPQQKPSCILSQREVCCTCTVERLVDVSPFFPLLNTSLSETLLIHPCTML